MLQKIQNLLPPNHPWGQQIIYLETVNSTNTYAKALASQGAPEGTVVLAKQQTGGRGRMGRSFSSPAGLGLYLSVILRTNCAPQELMHLTCAAGVAATNAVAAATGSCPHIKWTNDLVWGKRKLGGILTELSINSATGLVDYAIVGIGINCLHALEDFPEEIREIACSLQMILNTPTAVENVAAALIVELEKLSKTLLLEKPDIMAQFKRRCVTIGQEISIVRGGDLEHATALNIDGDGGLLVRLNSGEIQTITSGEVSIRGMYGYL